MRKKKEKVVQNDIIDLCSHAMMVQKNFCFKKEQSGPQSITHSRKVGKDPHP